MGKAERPRVCRDFLFFLFFFYFFIFFLNQNSRVEQEFHLKIAAYFSKYTAKYIAGTYRLAKMIFPAVEKHSPETQKFSLQKPIIFLQEIVEGHIAAENCRDDEIFSKIQNSFPLKTRNFFFRNPI